MEKQIEKILKRYGGLLPIRCTKEIAALYVDYYPKEFVEWIPSRIRFYNHVTKLYWLNEKEFKTLPDLFQYWSDNVKESEAPKSDNIPPECRGCEKMNPENCNTCKVINPQFDGV